MPGLLVHPGDGEGRAGHGAGEGEGSRLWGPKRTTSLHYFKSGKGVHSRGQPAANPHAYCACIDNYTTTGNQLEPQCGPRHLRLTYLQNNFIKRIAKRRRKTL